MIDQNTSAYTQDNPATGTATSGERSKNYPGFTTDQHHEIGPILARLYDELVEIATVAYQKYSRSSDYTRHLLTAVDELGRARHKGCHAAIEELSASSDDAENLAADDADDLEYLPAEARANEWYFPRSEKLPSLTDPEFGNGWTPKQRLSVLQRGPLSSCFLCNERFGPTNRFTRGYVIPRDYAINELGWTPERADSMSNAFACCYQCRLARIESGARMTAEELERHLAGLID